MAKLWRTGKFPVRCNGDSTVFWLKGLQAGTRHTLSLQALSKVGLASSRIETQLSAQRSAARTGAPGQERSHASRERASQTTLRMGRARAGQARSGRYAPTRRKGARGSETLGIECGMGWEESAAGGSAARNTVLSTRGAERGRGFSRQRDDPSARSAIGERRHAFSFQFQTLFALVRAACRHEMAALLPRSVRSWRARGPQPEVAMDPRARPTAPVHRVGASRRRHARSLPRCTDASSGKQEEPNNSPSNSNW